MFLDNYSNLIPTVSVKRNMSSNINFNHKDVVIIFLHLYLESLRSFYLKECNLLTIINLFLRIREFNQTKGLLQNKEKFYISF